MSCIVKVCENEPTMICKSCINHKIYCTVHGLAHYEKVSHKMKTLDTETKKN